MNKEQITIVIADDHPLLLEGVVSVLERELDNVIIHKATNGAEALQKITEIKPNIAILDIEMPLLDGIAVAKKIRETTLETKLVFLTLHRERSLFNEIDALEIDGYVLKEFSINEITQCVTKVLSGKKYYSKEIEQFIEKPSIDFSIFTKTEVHIIRLIAKDRTSKEIANMLFISIRTVDTHRHNICKKLNLKSEKNSLLRWVLKQDIPF